MDSFIWFISFVQKRYVTFSVMSSNMLECELITKKKKHFTLETVT